MEAPRSRALFERAVAFSHAPCIKFPDALFSAELRICDASEVRGAALEPSEKPRVIPVVPAWFAGSMGRMLMVEMGLDHGCASGCCTARATWIMAALAVPK